MNIHVFGTPDMARGDELAGKTVIVIDALRMTSVAVTALANGCIGLMAAAEVEEARSIAAASGALLGGERNALRIEGFDFSNSPLEYTRERVEGKKVVMSTSNGTRAILKASGADRLLLGAFINARSVARAVRAAEDLSIVCAGTMGAFTLEDLLAAGAIIGQLKRLGVIESMDDMAVAANILHQSADGDPHKLLRRTTHYSRLCKLGFEDDLDYCLREDVLEVVPERGNGGWFS